MLRAPLLLQAPLLPRNAWSACVQVGLLDFGQVKELPGRAQAVYAALVVAMAGGDEPQIRACMRAAGIVVDHCSPRFEAIAGLIMFDTRMDFPEARMSPSDAAAHEFRCASSSLTPRPLCPPPSDPSAHGAYTAARHHRPHGHTCRNAATA